MFTQVVGKVRLALAPAEPEWQHVPLYVTAWGLTTGPMPAGDRSVELAFDLVHHQLTVGSGHGDGAVLTLAGRSVAQFYEDVLAALGHLGVTVTINPKPQEVPDPIPFPEDDRAGYDPIWVARFHRLLGSVERVVQGFRAPFTGRHTKIQFFWGTFDIAYTRFSGVPASAPPGAGVIRRPSMDAEQYCCGFWPGDERRSEPAFFTFSFPKPEGLENASVDPGGWDPSMGEFILPYEAVRTARDPGGVLTRFFQQTYDATVQLGRWPSPVSAKT
jgi:hypothetical protein